MQKIAGFFLRTIRHLMVVLDVLINYHQYVELYKPESIRQSQGRLAEYTESFEALTAWVEERREFMKWLDEVDDILVKKEDSFKRRIYEVIDSYKKNFVGLSVLHDKPSCSIIDCGSICCYFPASERLCGVLIETEKLGRIRDMLEKEGKNPRDFIYRANWDELSADEKARVSKYSDMSHYLVREDGSNFVYHALLNKSRRIDWKMLQNAPQTLNDGGLWVNPYSYACKFLDQDNLCILHRLSDQAGEELCLKACRRFVCMLGYAINLLISLGVLELIDIKNKKVFSLYQLAERGLSALYDDVDDEDRLIKQVFVWEVALQDLIRAYISDEPGVSKKIMEVKKAEEEHKLWVRSISQTVSPARR